MSLLSRSGHIHQRACKLPKSSLGLTIPRCLMTDLTGSIHRSRILKRLSRRDLPFHKEFRR